jgi:hypothetical protein
MEHACVPGSLTTPGRPSACVGALGNIAFRYTDSVGTQNTFPIAAQWLACTFPCRRFADILADACARLGADVVRYFFIIVDLLVATDGSKGEDWAVDYAARLTVAFGVQLHHAVIYCSSKAGSVRSCVKGSMMFPVSTLSTFASPGTRMRLL